MSHLNPTVESVAACSSAAGQRHPAQHSAAACSGEIRQNRGDTTGILSWTCSDSLQEIFPRLATCGPKCNFPALHGPHSGKGHGANSLDKFLRRHLLQWDPKTRMYPSMAKAESQFFTKTIRIPFQCPHSAHNSRVPPGHGRVLATRAHTSINEGWEMQSLIAEVTCRGDNLPRIHKNKSAGNRSPYKQH